MAKVGDPPRPPQPAHIGIVGRAGQPAPREYDVTGRLDLSPGYTGECLMLPRLPQPPLLLNSGAAIMRWKATVRWWPEVLLCVSLIGFAYLAWQRWR